MKQMFKKLPSVIAVCGLFLVFLGLLTGLLNGAYQFLFAESATTVAEFNDAMMPGLPLKSITVGLALMVFYITLEVAIRLSGGRRSGNHFS